MMRALHIIIFTFMFYACTAQNITPNQILQKLYNKTNSVKDYSADANIKVDFPFIKMLPVNAKIYFKQKNKFRVISKSIAVLPKQGFDQAKSLIFDTTTFQSVIIGNEIIDKANATIINVFPLSDTSDVILGKLWIDKKENLILKSQITTKSNGTITSAYKYGNETKYGLPDLITLTVDVKKFKLPKSLGTDINKNTTEINKTKKTKTGTIYIKLSNYAINKGIPESIFKK